MSRQAKNVLKELLTSGSGKIGAAFFIALVIISIGVIVAYPANFGLRYWSNPVLWADNPQVAPPSWTNLFSSEKHLETKVFESTGQGERLSEPGAIRIVYRFNLNYAADEAPSFASLTVQNVSYQDRPPIIVVTVQRPDGKSISLYQLIVSGPRPGEQPPFRRYYDTPFRVQLSGEPNVASAVSDFLEQQFSVPISNQDLLVKGVDQAIFGVPDGHGGFKVLKGNYTIRVDTLLYNQSDSVGRLKYVVGGSVFGLLGTDTLGRDLSVGLLFGFPVALFIGLVTSVVTTFIGTVTGIVSGYMGGKTDTAIQRASDILANIPLLPILIFLAFIVGQNLFLIILILIAFSWPGLTILIRSMVLQIRSGNLVEATTTLGASKSRIMFRHIFPQTAPFVFATMIFSTPAAILAEASLSFLGLGDPSLPTWGQILESGFQNGGVYVGYWWWILPPGLLIVITAMTFVLLALALEPVVNPRLRRVQ